MTCRLKLSTKTLNVALVLMAMFISSCSIRGYGTWKHLEVIPTFHEVQSGQTLSQISKLYKVSVDTIALLNGVYDIDDIEPGQLLLISYSDNYEAPAPTSSPGSVQKPVSYKPVKETKLLWPVIHGKGRFTSGYGRRWGRLHKGIDIADKIGTPIVAAHDGEVVYAGSGISGFGNLVIIKGYEGLKTVYAHNSRLFVRKGERVLRGQKIAALGNTGRSTGPHLHFEVRKTTTSGQIIAVDPLPYVKR